MDHSSVNQILLNILTVFMALGALDKITQGKLRLGLAESFVEGISAMGPWRSPASACWCWPRP